MGQALVAKYGCPLRLAEAIACEGHGFQNEGLPMSNMPPVPSTTTFERRQVAYEDVGTDSTLRACSARTTLNSELWTSRWPLYSMKPKRLNLFMK
jgi:hypothetical protein